MAFAGGAVTVRDYGGKGRAVLLVHSLGCCSVAWDGVVEALAGQVHAYALDLPGHGASTVPVRRRDDARSSVVTVARSLELEAPLLVGV